jgi:hypothetical protein
MQGRLHAYRGRAGSLREKLFWHGIPCDADCPLWPTDRDAILFVNFWPLFYRETFQRVAELLADRDRMTTVVLSGKQPTPETPTRDRIRFHTVAGHLVPSALETAYSYRQTLRDAEGALRPELPGLLCDEGVSLWMALELEFEWLFRAEFPRLALQVAVAGHILDQHRPALVVSPDDADRGRIYTLLAKSRGIPSLVVQQGIVNEKAVEWQCLTGDAVAVFGTRSGEALRRHGVSPEHIHETGCPRFDVLFEPSPEADRQLRSDMNVPAGLALLLLASQPYVFGSFACAEARREMLRAVGKAVAAMENICLIVKPHPTENENELRTLVGAGTRIRYVDRRVDIQHLIRACDVFVTFFSTSGFQALIAGKPMISLRFPESGTDSQFADSGAVWTAESAEELIRHLRLLTGSDREHAMAEREPARQRFIYEWAYKPDGRATERVADLAISLMNGAKGKCK